MGDVNQELDLIRYPSGRLRCGPYNEPEAGKVLEMIERRLLSVALKSLRGFPVVGLTGPRQSGKTTLASFLGGMRP